MPKAYKATALFQKIYRGTTEIKKIYRGTSLVYQNSIEIPAGIILPFVGSVSGIPLGWALCDGTNGTPDLRERFVKAVTSIPGSSGGTKTHTHYISWDNDHNDHSGSTGAGPGHTHGFSGPGSTIAAGEPNIYPAYAGEHSHFVSNVGNSGGHDHSGLGGGSSTSMPAYFVVAFIMKT